MTQRISLEITLPCLEHRDSDPIEYALDKVETNLRSIETQVENIRIVVQKDPAVVTALTEVKNELWSSLEKVLEARDRLRRLAYPRLREAPEEKRP